MKIPIEIQEYIDLVEKSKLKTCEEQKKLIKHVKQVFKTEKLMINHIQLEKYMSYQKYFPFDLFPWEKFLFTLHNCVYKSNGSPRWPDLFILIGRGGGKNAYLSFEDFCLITDINGVAYYDIDICANSEEQAKTSFQDIYDVLENPLYKKKFEKHFYWTKTEIVNKDTKSKIKYRTNNPKGKDGLRSGKVDFDEPHAYENWENINVFTTGLGKKPHPRKTYISTNGDVRGGPLDELIKLSHEILDEKILDNGFLPFICKLNDENEVDDESNWDEANPSLPYLPTLKEEMQREYVSYKLDPAKNNGFMTKRMNIPKQNEDTVVTTWENIEKTNRALPDLKHKICVCGIDFMKVTDILSAILLFKERGEYSIIHHSWFCTNSRDWHRIKFPLREMERKGILTIVDDVEIHPSLAADWVYQQKQFYDIDMIAVDDYRYTMISRELKEIGYEAKDKKVKLVRPSDIMRVQPKIDSVLTGGHLIAGDDPMFRWAINNAKLEPAPNNNFKYGKIEPKSRKTDPFMAYVAAMTIEDQLPETSDMVFFDPIVF